jgi:hypothetical protein
MRLPPFAPPVLVPLFASLLAAMPSRAAEVTEVADAVDGDDPFDANIELRLELLRDSGLITRENTQPPEKNPDGAPRSVDVKEALYERVRFRVRPRLEIGIFHDLAAFAEWPIVTWDQTTFRYAPGTDAQNSTFARDQDPNPSPPLEGWQQTEGSGSIEPVSSPDGAKFGFPNKRYNDWRFDHDAGGTFAGYRQGFDNPTFGLRFSPVNNARDDTKPTITLQADYTPPFFQFMDPTADAIEDEGTPGPVADGAHRFHFSVAMSKRFLILDPYFVVEYGLPLAASGSGSLPGFAPRQQGGFMIGMEVVPYEDRAHDQKFAINFNAFATYFGPGRDYSEVSDLLKEMTFTDQWVRTGVNAGIFFRAFEYFFFELSGSMATDNEHLLTSEEFGKDAATDDNAQVDLDKEEERNVFFNPALDTVGRRVKIEQSLHLGAVVHAGITF